MTTFTGADGVSTFQALALRKGLELYAKTGIKPNRLWSPSNMVRTASRITGVGLKARDYTGAVTALTAWLDEHGTTGS